MAKTEATSGEATSRRGRGKGTVAKRIADIIAVVEAQLSSKQMKATVGDYLRLLQIQKEFGKQKPTKIQVTWVDPKTAGQ